jgi:hypothetical protein
MCNHAPSGVGIPVGAKPDSPFGEHVGRSFFMIIFKEKSPPDELEEMAGLRKSDSGLPVNLWLDDSSYYKRAGHWKRIKFQGDHGDKANPGNMFTMTISENPEIMPKSVEMQIKLPAKEIEKIRQFVKNNYELLSKLADQDITAFDFFKRMKL